MKNLKSITSAEIKNMVSENKVKFIGLNQYQVNNQGQYAINENALYKWVNSKYHKIAEII